MARGLAALLVFFFLLTAGLASGQEEAVVGELDAIWGELEGKYGNYMPRFKLGDMLNFSQLVNGLVRFFFHEVWANAALMGQLLVLAVLGALINNLQSAFASQGVAQVSRTVVFLVLLAICMYSFTISLDLARRVVNNMTDIVLALVPVMLALLAGMGSLAAAAIFQPVLLTAASLVGMLVANVVLPLLLVAALLAVVDRMMAGAGLSRLAKLLKDCSVWLMGLLFALFVGVTVINGTVAAIADGVALRTGKYAAKAGIPVIGSMFADAFETVAGASLVLKNSVGVFGMVAVIIACAFPALKIFVIAMICRAMSALTQPLGEDGISDTLDSMAGYLYAVLGAVVAVALMFLLVVSIIMAAANLMVMVR